MTDFPLFAEFIPPISPLVVISPITNRSSEELTNLYFRERSFSMQAPDIDTLIKQGKLSTRSFARYVDYNKDNILDQDELIYSSIFYFSKDAILLEKVAKSVAAPKSDEILVFIEDNESDTFSDQQFFIRIGKKVVENLKKNTSYVDFTYQFEEAGIGTGDEDQEELAELIQQLIEESIAEGKTTTQIIQFFKSLYNSTKVQFLETAADIFDTIAKFLNEDAKIPASVWNIDDPNYSFGDFEDTVFPALKKSNDVFEAFANKGWLLPDWSLALIQKSLKITNTVLEFIEQNKKELEKEFAYVCGFWNGVMDFVSGLFSLAKLLMDAAKANHEYQSNKEYYHAIILEYLDNFIQAVEQIDWKKLIITAHNLHIRFGYFLFVELPPKLWDKARSLNHTEIGYYQGYIAVNVLEFFIPPLKFAKVAKGEKVVRLFDDVVRELNIAGRAARRTVTNQLSVLLKLLDNFLEVVRKGTDEIIKFIKKIYQKIRKWLEDTLGIGKKVNKSNFDELYPIYGKLLAKGQKVIKKEFDLELDKVQKFLDSQEYKDGLETAYEKYKNSDIVKKLDPESYVVKYRNLVRNKKAGDAAEELIDRYLGGRIRPKKSIRIPPPPYKRRFPDNFDSGIMREVKSGNLTMRYEAQINKDIKILVNQLRFNKNVTKKIEWHVMGEVDEVVLKHIQMKMSENGWPINRFQIFLY